MIVYISYDEPRRSPFRVALAVLAILLALAVIAAVIIGVIWWVNNRQDSSVAAPVDAVPLPEAVAPLYASNTNTIFLVDVSQSIQEGGNLDAVKSSLINVALPYINPAAGTAAANSRAALVAFTSATETLVPLRSLDDTGNQRAWLERVETLSTSAVGGTFIYDAVRDAHEMLESSSEPDQANVIVLLTDGLDGAILKAGSSAPPGIVLGDGTELPEGMTLPVDVTVSSETTRDELVGLLVNSNVIVHTIGVGAEADHVSLEILAQATGGRYTYASR